MSYFSARLLGLLGTIALLSGCGGGGGGSSKPQAPGTPTPTVTAAPVPTATAAPTETVAPTATPVPTITAPPTPTPTPVPNAERLSNISCIAPDGVVQPGAVASVAAFPNLPAVGFPISLVQAPNAAGGFWFVAGLEGRVYSFDNQSNTSGLQSRLDIRARVATQGEFGLTGMALHPNYPSDNRIFLLYNDENNAGRSTLSSFTVDTATRAINPNSEVAVLTLDQLSTVHNGGDLHFGTDGFLYASFGDTDWAGGDYAQDNRNLYGTIVRIDINAGSPYGIPDSNPFSGNNRCGSTATNSQNCPEIFAFGFRNPWRFSIDSQTGDVWVGDVGDEAREEVNRVVRGGNYGWPIMEGNIRGPGNSNCNRSGLELPIADYPSSSSSVAGGYVYRGTQYPSLSGRYIFSDIYSGQYFSVPSDAGANTEEEQLFVGNGFSVAMAQGNDGELYALTSESDSPGQNIYRISGGGGVSYTMPQNLSDTGCFNVASKTSPSGVFDYSNIAPLWSDGAAKLRAFAIPDGTDIQVLTDGDFDFPTDSILIKHFLNGSTYLETRLMVNHSTGWVGYSYEWNDAQTEALLLSEGKRKDVGPFVHIYPSQAECQACHTDAANNSLGLELAQLNKTSSELDANFIDYLSAAGYLASDHFGAGSPTLYALNDDSASLEQRARSYLHSNCANCHRPGGPVAGMDLRYSTSLANTNACNVDPQRGNLGVSGAKIIAPSNPDASVLLLRMLASEASGNRMPRLGSIVVDTEATQLISDWIGGLGACP